MKGFLRKSVLLFTVFISALTAMSPVALAATNTSATASTAPFDLLVSPISQQLEVAQGGSASITVQVQNRGVKTEHIVASIYSFGAHGEDGTPQLIKPTASDEFISWASLSAVKFDAEPNVWVNEKLTIDAPKTAAFGYYYAVVFSRDGQAPTVKNVNTSLGAVASLVLVNVDAPGAKRKVDIAEFSTGRKSMEFLPATFTVRMHNTGNTHVAPRGNIFIKKGTENIALLEVNPEKGQILPSSYRLFDTQWKDGTPVYIQKLVNGKAVPGTNGKQATTLSWSNFNFSKLRFGRYTAKLVMVYNDGKSDVADNAQLSFWVIPWRIIAAGIVILVILLAGLWSLVIRPVRRKVKSRHEGPVSFR